MTRYAGMTCPDCGGIAIDHDDAHYCPACGIVFRWKRLT